MEATRQRSRHKNIAKYLTRITSGRTSKEERVTTAKTTKKY
jgi:hypothetical protein